MEDRLSSEEIALLKKEFGITSDSILKVKVENMSDLDLDVLLNRLKNPGTTAYPDYKEPAKQTTAKPAANSTGASADNKEQDFENNFRRNKSSKGITDAEFSLLKASAGGNETEAKKMVINMPKYILNDIINKQKKVNEEELIALSNNSYSHDKLRDEYSEQEIELLKRYFNINDENKLILKTDSMPDFDMDVLLHRLKQPFRLGMDNTNAYSGYGLGSGVPESLVQSELSNSNTANNFSNEEIQLFKNYYHKESEADIVDKIQTLSDYELDKALKYQKNIQQREDILDKAYEYLNYTWIPAQDLVGYNGGVEYKKGELRHGPAYSQHSRISWDEFDEKLDDSDFYSPFTRAKDNVIMPMYGQDCSGFVSDVWNLPKMGTWTIHDQIEGKYEEPKYDYFNLYQLSSFHDLKPGDAVLSPGHHIRLVSKVIGDTVYCIEQTTSGDDGTQKNSYLISELEAENYIPISKFKP